MTPPPDIRLFPFDSTFARRVLDDPNVLAGEFLLQIAHDDLPMFREVMVCECEKPGVGGQWMSYLIVCDINSLAVGTCAFKTTPVPNGCVEIAYATFPNQRGRGFASAAASALTKLAFETYRISRVIARTLPERNASCRVLEKSGFRLLGDVIDPEDGPVWEWERLAPQ